MKIGVLEKSEMTSSTAVATTSYLLFNFVSAVGIIFVNKMLFSNLPVPFIYPLALSFLHYIVTYAGLLVLEHLQFFSRQPKPMTPRLWLLAAVVGIAPGLNNLSLKSNSVGFYTVVKLLVTPMICILEYAFQGKSVSTRRAFALLLLSIGVVISSVNDVELKPAGLTVASLWLPVAAVYKVLWSREQKEEGWGTLSLMMKVLPFSILFMLAMMFLPIDPPGILSYPFNSVSVGLLCLSGVGAFCVNFSGFLVLGACQPLTHVVLGQVKSASLILGAAFFSTQVPSLKALIGACIAILGSTLYAMV